MRKLLILLFVFLTALTYSQTNATFKNLDVRETSKFRGLIYPFGASAKTPLSASDEVLMVELPSFKLVRVDFSELADSIANYITTGTTETASNRNTYGLYSRKLVNDLQFRGIKSTDGYIDFLDSTTYIGLTLDTANLFDAIPIPPQYWTFVDSATDTLKNNVATAGVVAIKGNLELQTTTSTVGIVNQNGNRLLHTYNDNSNNPNLFLGITSGNYTLSGNDNIGIGLNTLKLLTTGYNNIAIGNGAMGVCTTAYDNTVIGLNALNTANALRTSVVIGNNAGQTSSTYASVYVGYSAGKNMSGGSNIGIGYNALLATSPYSGIANSMIGAESGNAMSSGNNNTGLGAYSLHANKTGGNNTSVGYESLDANVGNSSSTAIGYQAMLHADSRTSGRDTYNTAIGYLAMDGSGTTSNNIGQYNTATGHHALKVMTDANYNSVYGVYSGDAISTGDFNTLYGYNAGGGLTTGDSNILIGTSAGAQLTTESDQLYIDNTNTTTPLIHGNMRTDYVTINGQFTTDNSFGELFEDAANVTATVATYKTIVSLQAGQYNEATLTDSSMTITQAGTYLVNYSSSFTHSVNNTLCHISLFVNDTEDTSLEAERKIGTAGDFGSMSGTALVTLTANAVLKLKAKSDNNGDLTLNHLNFNCTRIK